MASYTKHAGTIKGIPFPELETETWKNMTASIIIDDLEIEDEADSAYSHARLILHYLDIEDGLEYDLEVTTSPFTITWKGGLG